jgi:hypothetical protein
MSKSEEAERAKKFRERSHSNPAHPSTLIESRSSDREGSDSVASSTGSEFAQVKDDSFVIGSKKAERAKRLFRSRSPKDSNFFSSLHNGSSDDSSGPPSKSKSKTTVRLKLSPRDLTKDALRPSEPKPEYDQYFSLDYYKQAYENLKKVAKLLQARDEENRQVIADQTLRIADLEKLVSFQQTQIDSLTKRGKEKKDRRRSLALSGRDSSPESGKEKEKEKEKEEKKEPRLLKELNDGKPRDDPHSLSSPNVIDKNKEKVAKEIFRASHPGTIATPIVNSKR